MEKPTITGIFLENSNEADQMTSEDLQQQLDQLDAEIESVKSKLIAIGPMRPGNLTRQYQRPQQKKVPYWQLSYTHHQKSYSDYIRDSLYEQILIETQAYQRFSDLIQQWTDLAIQRGQLALKIMRTSAPRRLPKRNTKEKKKT